VGEGQPLRPTRYSILKNPSGMSTLGVPYSPLVRSLIRRAWGRMSAWRRAG